MKSLEQIKQQRNIMVVRSGQDGGMGYILGLDKKRPMKYATVVWSNGLGWDHVSVSWSRRCPTWDEMARVKDMFFDEEDTVVQYHPPKSQYVNFLPYCLHMWRVQDGEFPSPPTWMIGPKDGEGVTHALDECVKAYLGIDT